MQSAIRLLVGTICLLAASTVFAAAASRSTVPVVDFDTSVPIGGGAQSTLVRTNHGVSMTINTNGLESGAAYTNWWVIFNVPGECDGDCGLPDLANPDVMASVLFATGNVVPWSGDGHFAAHLSVGDTGGALFGPGLTDARGADVHLIVRSHGEMIPSQMPAQINSFGGGCFINTCTDVQVAVHNP